MFISTGSIQARTNAELARHDVIITNHDHDDRILPVQALNPDCKFMVYKNIFLCNDYGRELTGGHGIGSSGVSATELEENPDFALKTMLTEPYEDSVMRDSPDVFYALGEASGTAFADSSGHGYTGTHSVATSVNQATLDGNAGDKSIRFTGGAGSATDYPILGDQDYTFEAWIKPTSILSPITILGSDGTSGHRILWQIHSNGEIRFWTDSQSSDIGNAYQGFQGVDEIQHVAVTYRSTTREITFFVNGLTVASDIVGQGIDGANVGNLVIGAWEADRSHDPFAGYISHVAVYKHCLNERRLTAHYINGPETGPGGGVPAESEAFPGNFLGDVGHPDYQSLWISNVLLDTDFHPWDGIFMDDLDDTARFHFGVWIGVPDDPYSPLVDDDLRIMMTEFLANVCPTMRYRGEVWANIANSARPDEHNLWTPYLDHATREFWHKFGTGDSRPNTPSYPAGIDERFVTPDILFEDDFIPNALARGCGITMITYGSVEDTVGQLYGYAGVLLDVDAATGVGYCYAKGVAVEDSWTIYWTKDIGHPVSEKTDFDLAKYTREFTDGLVVFNGSDSDWTFYTGEWQQEGFTRLSTGLQVPSSFVLPAATAEIISGARSVPNVRSKVSMPKRRGRVSCRPETVLIS